MGKAKSEKQRAMLKRQKAERIKEVKRKKEQKKTVALKKKKYEGKNQKAINGMKDIEKSMAAMTEVKMVKPKKKTYSSAGSSLRNSLLDSSVEFAQRLPQS